MKLQPFLIDWTLLQKFINKEGTNEDIVHNSDCVLYVVRLFDTGDETIGAMYVNGKFFCYTLEDERRDVKVKGETRIPEGVYKLGIQETVTPLTTSYRSRYDFFTNHLHVKDVPNFTGIYIHVGNTDEDTAGCILVGKSATTTSLRSSTVAYKELYEQVIPFAEKDKACIIIIDLMDMISERYSRNV